MVYRISFEWQPPDRPTYHSSLLYRLFVWRPGVCGTKANRSARRRTRAQNSQDRHLFRCTCGARDGLDPIRRLSSGMRLSYRSRVLFWTVGPLCKLCETINDELRPNCVNKKFLSNKLKNCWNKKIFFAYSYSEKRYVIEKYCCKIIIKN